MAFLPLDIWNFIILFLNIKDKLNLLFVCKFFNTIVQNPFLWKNEKFYLRNSNW